MSLSVKFTCIEVAIVHGAKPTRPERTKVSMTMSLPSLDEVIRKLETLPLDQLKQLLTEQLDLEIRLKHKELQMADAELGKCEGQMVMLRKFFDIPHTTRLENEPHDFAVKYFDLLNKAINTTYADLKQQEEAAIKAQEAAESAIAVHLTTIPPKTFTDIATTNNHTYRTRSLTSVLRPVVSSLINPERLGCLFRRTDGVIVKISCPDCGRANFKSILQFISHARNAHSREFASQDDAALQCGQIIVEIKQDLEGEALIQLLIQRGLNPNTNLNLKSFLPEFESTSTSKPPTKRARIALGSLLLKKVSRELTVTKDQFKEMLADVQAPVGNAHLFDGEDDHGGSDDSDEGCQLTPEPVLNMHPRRKPAGSLIPSRDTTNRRRRSRTLVTPT